MPTHKKKKGRVVNGIDAILYSDIHKWIRKNYGPADRCEGGNCNGISKRFHWSLLHGKNYARIREHYHRLCSSCHAKYDSTPEGRKNGALKRTGKARPYIWRPVAFLKPRSCRFVSAYQSLTQAAKALNASVGAVSTAINRGGTLRGYHIVHCAIEFPTLGYTLPLPPKKKKS